MNGHLHDFTDRISRIERDVDAAHKRIREVSQEVAECRREAAEARSTANMSSDMIEKTIGIFREDMQRIKEGNAALSETVCEVRRIAQATENLVIDHIKSDAVFQASLTQTTERLSRRIISLVAVLASVAVLVSSIITDDAVFVLLSRFFGFDQ